MPDYRQTQSSGQGNTRPRSGTGQKKSKVHFTYFIALFVMIYLVAQFVIFLSRDTLNYVVAKQGEIVETFSAQGVVIREEQLVKATADGIVQYYHPGGKELQKGSLVCTLMDDYYGDILEEKISEIYSQIQEADRGEYEEASNSLDNSISSAIASYLRNKTENDYAAMYRLKENLEDAVSKRKDMYSLMSNTKVAALLSQQGIYLNEQSSVLSNLYLSDAGVIDYSYDGYEGWTVDQIGADFINQYNGAYSYFEINMQKITSGTPLYRLISSPVWNIVIYITEEQAQYFSGEYSVSFVYNSTEKMTGIIQSLEQVGDNQYKLVLKLNSKVQEFMNDRIANLVFTKNSRRGIKISDSCIVQQSYYCVPAAYIVSSGNDQGVLAVEGSGVSFKKLTVAAVVDGKAYIELGESVQAGTVIQAENSTDTTTISEIEQVEGVYVVNGGYEQFQIIKKIYQAQGYAIVEGISLYDRIKINS